VNTIVPVGIVQVGCITLDVVGTAGGIAGLTVSDVGAETHVISAVLLTVTLYVAAARSVKVAPGW
jgi:hypothetical protein